MDYPLRCNYFINSVDQELHLTRQYSFSCQRASGLKEIRTPNPLVANEVRYRCAMSPK